MIDLSHLTEEEQGVIMAVLKRDAELKKAEEARIRKLEVILSRGSKSDSKLKYLTGEWFYEVKSRRHKDKIHGSEIILASMKQRKTSGFDGSLRSEKPKTSGGRVSDAEPPRKPARCLDIDRPKERNHAERKNLNSGLRSPRAQRHNPFNSTALAVLESTDNADVSSDGDNQKTPGPEPKFLRKYRLAGGSSQTSEGSGTSEGSSPGFRPIPKKRTFVSRRTSSQSDNDSRSSEAPGSTGMIPGQRRGVQRGPDGSSDQLQTTTQTLHPAGNGRRHGVSQDSSVSYSGGDEHRPSLTRERAIEAPQGDEKQVQSEQRAGESLGRLAGSVRDTDRGSGVTNSRPADLSFTQSSKDADPPISYDLNFIDTPDPQSQKKSNRVFKLTTQRSCPASEEDDSITKVLDWFSRSTDNLNEAEMVTKTSEGNQEGGTLGSKMPLRRDSGDVKSDKKREGHLSDMQRQTNEVQDVKAIGRRGNNELVDAEGDVRGELEREARRLREVKAKEERQAPKISQMKSFWEKNTAYPKVTKTTAQRDNHYLSVEKDDEHMETPNGTSDPVSEIYTNNGIYGNRPLTDGKGGEHVHVKRNQEVHGVPFGKQVSENRKASVGDRRGSEVEFFSVAQPHQQPQSPSRPSRSPESQGVSGIQPNLQAGKYLSTRKAQLHEQQSTSLDSVQQHRDGTDSEDFYLSRNNTDPKLSGNDEKFPSRTRVDSSEEVRLGYGDDKSNQSGMSPKRTGDASNKDRTNGQSPRPSLVRQESMTEKIKQLKSFWEQERKKPVFYGGKPKAGEDGKASRFANKAKLSKRFTKSEYDLTSVGHSVGSDEDANRNQQNFSIIPLNQRLDKLSPSLGTSRAQFNTLREFWDEALSETKSPSFEKPKSPKRRDSVGAQLLSQEFRGGDPEYHLSHYDRETGSAFRTGNDSRNCQPGYTAAESGQQRESRRSSKDSVKAEEKAAKSQSGHGKEARSPKRRKDSLGSSGSRGGAAMRRATSMFALNFGEDKDKVQLKMEVSPVHSQSRKQSLDRTPTRRPNAEKGSGPRRKSEEIESLTPRARAFVPTDYRHYLGMTDEISALRTPGLRSDPTEDKSGYGFDLGGPVRASTPVASEERFAKKAGKASQRPAWVNSSGSDTGQDSSLSSASGNWSSSRAPFNRDTSDENLNPVRKALQRAEARPRNLAKSMEDITATVSPRQERRQDPSADLRRPSDGLPDTSPSSSLYSDAEHLKKMSKSVPSFLQKENHDRDADFPGEKRERQIMDISMTNLSSSSLSSVPSLSGSVMTMYSGDFGNVEVQGNIQFSINYVQRLKEFHIFVAECRDLAVVDPKRGRSDPYVKSYLVPDKAHLGKRKTSVKKKTVNPTFNEILRYRVRMEYLRTQTLILSVWHHDTFGRNSFLGEVDVDLSKWDFDHTQMNYLALKARTTPVLTSSNDRGEMKLAVRFVPEINHTEGLPNEGPTTGEVHIWVKECKNLPVIRATIDPYVKCFILPDTSKKSRQKTRVLRRTADPVFNHTMVYDGIREADLMEACVELTVWDRDRLASNLLGGLRLGAGTGRSYGAAVDWMDSTLDEVALWERVITSPNEWVEDVLPLRMVNSAKTTSK